MRMNTEHVMCLGIDGDWACSRVQKKRMLYFLRLQHFFAVSNSWSIIYYVNMSESGLKAVWRRAQLGKSAGGRHRSCERDLQAVNSTSGYSRPFTTLAPTYCYNKMVFSTQGPVSFTKTTLSYPVYAAEFDPYNRGFLVVGGGGGQGRSGVANKIVSHK